MGRDQFVLHWQHDIKIPVTHWDIKPRFFKANIPLTVRQKLKKSEFEPESYVTSFMLNFANRLQVVYVKLLQLCPLKNKNHAASQHHWPESIQIFIEQPLHILILSLPWGAKHNYTTELQWWNTNKNKCKWRINTTQLWENSNKTTIF